MTTPAPYQKARYRYGADGFWRSGTIQGPRGGSPTLQTYAQMSGSALTSPGGAVNSFVLGTTKPDSTNTGVPAGTALTTQTGDITVTVAGTVIQNLYLVGRVKVQAANVTVRNCEIVGNGYSGGNTALVDCNHSAASNVTIDRCTLHQAVSTGNLWTNGVIGHDYTATRCNMYDVVDGCGAYNSGSPSALANVAITGNYIHDLAYFSPDPNHSDNHTHNDGVQIQGNSGITVRGNSLSINASTTLGTPSLYAPGVTGQCITGSPNVSQISGVTIDQNWMDYGSRGVVFIVGSQPAGVLGTCTGNRFGSHLHSPTIAVQIDTAAGQTFSTFSGNTWLADGSAVNLSSGTG